MKVFRQILLKTVCVLLAAIGCTFASGCAGDKRSTADSSAPQAPVGETTPAAAASATPSQTPSHPNASKASPAELHVCLKRVYGDAVSIDESRRDNYVTGDFNGDGSPDIAIVVRPGTGKLPEINDELANWILKDPREAQLPVAGKQTLPLAKKSARVKVQQSDILLAIIHGHTSEGWRSPTATQTYLLKNAVGTDLRLWPRAEIPGANQAHSTEISGDAIGETLAKESGFLYWTGAEYGWHR